MPLKRNYRKLNYQNLMENDLIGSHTGIKSLLLLLVIVQVIKFSYVKRSLCDSVQEGISGFRLTSDDY